MAINEKELEAEINERLALIEKDADKKVEKILKEGKSKTFFFAIDHLNNTYEQVVDGLMTRGGKVMIGGKPETLVDAGKHVYKHDRRLAYAYFKKSIHLPDKIQASESHKFIGEYYHFGCSDENGIPIVEQNLELAKDNYLAAIKLGNQSAENNLELIYQDIYNFQKPG